MLKEIKSFDKTKIAYNVQKNKTRWFLVFLHGAGGDLKAWDTERNFFHAKGISTIAIDMRGHGLSDRPQRAEDYSLDHFANDIYCVIKHEHVKNYILVGHCFGGMVAMNYQKLFPNQAKSYVFIDTTDKAPLLLEAFDSMPFLRAIINLILDNTKLRTEHFSHINYLPFVGGSDLDMKRLLSDISHMSFKSWILVYETIAEFDAKAILETITRPALVIHGEKDTIFHTSIAEDIRKHLQEGTLDLIPDANHVIVLNNPETLVYEIWKFLSNIQHIIKIRMRGGNRLLALWLRSLNTEPAEEEVQ